MAAAKQTQDQYANKAYGQCIESAANTLTFTELPTNIDIMAKVAWVISRIEWYFDPTMTQLMAGGGDAIQVALTASKGIATLSMSEAAVIDFVEYEFVLRGTAANFELFQKPFLRDFSSLPGGGLIVAPRPLYVAVKGTSLASPVTANCRIYFRTIELDSASYIDLVDFYRIIS
jgi:hypothetical protein